MSRKYTVSNDVCIINQTCIEPKHCVTVIKYVYLYMCIV